MSEGYTAGSIEAAVNAVLPPRRVAKIQDPSRSGVEVEEFIHALAKMPYTYKDENDKFIVRLPIIEALVPGANEPCDCRTTPTKSRGRKRDERWKRRRLRLLPPALRETEDRRAARKAVRKAAKRSK